MVLFPLNFLREMKMNREMFVRLVNSSVTSITKIGYFSAANNVYCVRTKYVFIILVIFLRFVCKQRVTKFVYHVQIRTYTCIILEH